MGAVLSPLTTTMGIQVDELAVAMVELVVKGSKERVVKNQDLVSQGRMALSSLAR